MKKEKYALTGVKKVIRDPAGHYHTLHRIKALIGFYTAALMNGRAVVIYIEQGQYGGWIESMNNLSQEGNCWVDDEAVVYGAGFVCGDAWVGDNAAIAGSAIIGGFAKMAGHSDICDRVRVGGNVRITGESKIRGEIDIKGFTLIDSSRVGGIKVEVQDHSVIKNSFLYINEKNVTRKTRPTSPRS